LAQAAKKRGQAVSELVRQGLRRIVSEPEEVPVDTRIARILKFARFSGPTGDMDQILDEIERGRTPHLP